MSCWSTLSTQNSYVDLKWSHTRHTGSSVPNGEKTTQGCTCSAVHTTPGPPGEPTAHRRHPQGAYRHLGPIRT